MTKLIGGIDYNRYRREYLYTPEPMTADECEAIAACLPWSDTWGHELLEAAEEMRRRQREDDETLRPGLWIVVKERER